MDSSSSKLNSTNGKINKPSQPELEVEAPEVFPETFVVEIDDNYYPANGDLDVTLAAVLQASNLNEGAVLERAHIHNFIAMTCRYLMSQKNSGLQNGDLQSIRLKKFNNLDEQIILYFLQEIVLYNLTLEQLGLGQPIGENEYGINQDNLPESKTYIFHFYGSINQESLGIILDQVSAGKLTYLHASEVRISGQETDEQNSHHLKEFALNAFRTAFHYRESHGSHFQLSLDETYLALDDIQEIEDELERMSDLAPNLELEFSQTPPEGYLELSLQPSSESELEERGDRPSLSPSSLSSDIERLRRDESQSPNPQ